MEFTSIQTSKVTSGSQILATGPCWYFGLIASRHKGISGCTIIISDSATQAVVGSNVDWVALHSGSSMIGSYVNTVRSAGTRMQNGLRAIATGLASGTTVIVHWS